MHLLEFLYYLGFSVKQYYSIKHQKRLPCRVISIGNITVGGTGKTPAVIAVAEEAQKRGMRPVILTRGYKGRAKGPCFVTRGEGPLLSVEDAGDEPVLMAGRLNGVPIVKGANRFEAGMFAIRELPIGDTELNKYIFVLDDGFQHRSLYRDKDIVLIDAGDPFGNGMLLPFGRLREPVKSLSRADIIVLTKTGGDSGQRGPCGIDKLREKINSHREKSRIFLSNHTPVSIILPSGRANPDQWLSGKKVFVFCALGSPDSFLRTLSEAGADVRGFHAYKDHYQYAPEDISGIKNEAKERGAEWIVTTEKDIIKIRNLDLPDNISVVKIVFSVNEDFYCEVFGL